MKSICVFVSANDGGNEDYKKAAHQLGKQLAQKNTRLVYGGASVGLMGILANSVLEHGGEVFGVMTKHLSQTEITHHGLTELKLVGSMQEGKQLMVSESDAVIALLGRLGTLEETFEVWNSVKTGLYNKPIGILNTNHYYDLLLAFIENAAEKGLIRRAYKDLLYLHECSTELLAEIMESVK